jgi:hypothetical protein
MTVIFLGALAALGGCPSTLQEGACYRDGDCDHGYQCDDSGACVALPNACHAPSDCSPGYTCGDNGQCLPGDCYFNGCVAGFQCESATGRWQCAQSSSGAAGSSNEDTTQAGAGGAFDAAGQRG